MKVFNKTPAKYSLMGFDKLSAFDRLMLHSLWLAGPSSSSTSFHFPYAPSDFTALENFSSLFSSSTL